MQGRLAATDGLRGGLDNDCGACCGFGLGAAGVQEWGRYVLQARRQYLPARNRTGWQPMSVSSFPEGQRICVIPLAQTLTLTAIARRLLFVPSEASRLQVRPAVVVVVTDRSPLNPSVA